MRVGRALILMRVGRADFDPEGPGEVVRCEAIQGVCACAAVNV